MVELLCDDKDSPMWVAMRDFFQTQHWLSQPQLVEKAQEQ
jgi:hypothetical protein